MSYSQLSGIDFVLTNPVYAGVSVYDKIYQKFFPNKT